MTGLDVPKVLITAMGGTIQPLEVTL